MTVHSFERMNSDVFIFIAKTFTPVGHKLPALSTTGLHGDGDSK